MAFSYALVHRTARLELYEVTETLDADVGGNILHALARIPVKVTLTRILAAAILSDTIVTDRTAALIELTSVNAVGSGDADPQLLVLLEIPDDEIR